jgi:nicotinate phosphoribosyltransferase
MAHSYVQVHASEQEAFERFIQLYPDTVLLVDTYDTLAAVRKVADLGRRLGPDVRVRAIRLDSGDIAALAWQARDILDQAGLGAVRIFASSDLDEHRIASILAGGAPIDGFGVGTRLVVSTDAPSLEMVYKLVEYDGRPRVKLSANKVVYPRRKQIFRESRDGRMAGDTVGRHDEALPGHPLIAQVMAGGKRLAAGRATLPQARARAAEELGRLPEELLRLEPARSPYPVRYSPALEAEIAALRRAQGG